MKGRSVGGEAYLGSKAISEDDKLFVLCVVLIIEMNRKQSQVQE